MHLFIGSINNWEEENEYITLYNLDIPKHGGDWFHIHYETVDRDVSKKPEIVFDVRVTPWTFCEDNKYEVVIDTESGEVVFDNEKNEIKEEYFKEINRILEPGGRFYCYRRNGNFRNLFIYIKPENKE